MLKMSVLKALGRIRQATSQLGQTSRKHAYIILTPLNSTFI